MSENDRNLTPEELQEAGSIEANTWTITPPGGQAMSLDEHEKKRQEEEAFLEEQSQRMREDQDAQANRIEES